MNERNLFDPQHPQRGARKWSDAPPMAIIERCFISTPLPAAPFLARNAEIIQLNLANFRGDPRRAMRARETVSCSRRSAAVCRRIIYVRIHDIMIPRAPDRRHRYAGAGGGGNYRASCSAFLGPALDRTLKHESRERRASHPSVSSPPFSIRSVNYNRASEDRAMLLSGGRATQTSDYAARNCETEEN